MKYVIKIRPANSTKWGYTNLIYPVTKKKDAEVFPTKHYATVICDHFIENCPDYRFRIEPLNKPSAR